MEMDSLVNRLHPGPLWSLLQDNVASLPALLCKSKDLTKFLTHFLFGTCKRLWLW